jgi:WD40 repeat protein
MRLYGKRKERARSFAFSGDSRCFVAGFSFGLLRVWWEEYSRTPYELSPPRSLLYPSVVVSIAVSQNGTRIVGGEARCVRVWDSPPLRPTDHQFTRLISTYGFSSHVCMNAAGSMVGIGDTESCISVWKVPFNKKDPTKLQSQHKNADVSSVASISMSSDATKILYGCVDGSSTCLNAIDGTATALVHPFTMTMCWDSAHVSVSANGRVAATGALDAVRAWDTETGCMILEVGDLGPVTSVAVSPVGDWIAAYINGRVVLLDTRTSKTVEEMRTDGMCGPIFASANGRKIACKTMGGHRASIWNASAQVAWWRRRLFVLGSARNLRAARVGRERLAEAFRILPFDLLRLVLSFV